MVVPRGTVKELQKEQQEQVSGRFDLIDLPV